MWEPSSAPPTDASSWCGAAVPLNVGLWSVPGGRVEAGESLEDAVHREVREETGLQVELRGIAGHVVLPAARAGDSYVVTDYRAVVAPGTSAEPVAGDDAAAARWVSRAELGALACTPGLIESLDAWQVW